MVQGGEGVGSIPVVMSVDCAILLDRAWRPVQGL